MREYTIIINTTPKPQARHRDKNITDKMGRTYSLKYDPSKEIKNWYRLQIQQQFDERLSCPIEMFVTFFMPIPKSTSKKRHLLMDEGIIRHQKKPDRDNLDKLLTDAMTDIVYVDDSQIWHSDVYKVYSDNPRTEVTIKWDENYKY